MDVPRLDSARGERLLLPCLTFGEVAAKPPGRVIPFHRSRRAQQPEQPHRRPRQHIDHQVTNQRTLEAKEKLIDVVDVGIEITEPALQAREGGHGSEHIDQPGQLEGDDLAAGAGLPLRYVKVSVAFPRMPIRQVLAAVIGEGQRSADRSRRSNLFDAARAGIIPHRARRRANKPAAVEPRNQRVEARVGYARLGEEVNALINGLQAKFDVPVGRG